MLYISANHEGDELLSAPQRSKKIKMDGKAVSHEVKWRATNIYMIVYLMIVAASIFIISFDEFDLVTNFTAVVTTF